MTNRYQNGWRRRQVRACVFRDEDYCALCGGLVDKTLPAYLPDSPEIDEIIPYSRGGSPYDRANCQLTHRRCNRSKGNGIQRKQRPPITTYISSRTWTT